MVWYYLQLDPADAAGAFLEQVAAEEFSGLDDYFTTDAHPTDADFRRAFGEFGEAFALTNIELTDLTLLSKTSTEAEFSFALEYTSSYFEPLSAQGTLAVKRAKIFDQWKIQWQDNLPLPEYGLEARYSRTRLDPSRGRIVDNSGQILAGEGSRVTVGVQPDRISAPEWLLGSLEAELGLDPQYVVSQYEAPGVQGHWFIPLITVSEEEYQRVDPELRPIPGVFFRRVEVRAYPEGSTTGHITGYLGEVTQEMMNAYPEREYVSGEIAGRAGLESSRDDVLRGRPGYRFYVERAGDTPVLLGDKAAEDGVDLELTLERAMQELAYVVLGEQAGALVVINAETGAVLTLASTLAMILTVYRRHQCQPLAALSLIPTVPCLTVPAGLYPPGPVFKVLTVAAAVNEGSMNPQHLYRRWRAVGTKHRPQLRAGVREHTLHDALSIP